MVTVELLVDPAPGPAALTLDDFGLLESGSVPAAPAERCSFGFGDSRADRTLTFATERQEWLVLGAGWAHAVAMGG
ncbi:hypothetical protein [Actinoplanes sp. RD1]|uniref:hypothetical protein n=1 Tax=Actinoplanes sp. RD1 TaxID=3064538 RepID=UPI002741F1EF|nr:hypothetical protein [Actinoplanes sp. RD1]